MDKRLPERIVKRIRKEVLVPALGECWTWTGALVTKGYAQTTINGRNVLIHRFAYETFIGPIPDGLVIDHLCRNRACINPSHLEAVTIKVNIRRGYTGDRIYRACLAGLRGDQEKLSYHLGQVAINKSR